LVPDAFDFADRELVFAVLGFLAADFVALPFPGRIDFTTRFAAGTATGTAFAAAFSPRAVCRAARLTTGINGSFSALFPTTAPTTPPTAAPTGPPTAPRTAPAAAPVADFDMGGRSMFLLDLERRARNLDFFLINFGPLAFGAGVRLKPAPILIRVSLRVWRFFEILSYLHYASSG
jgi:hypothetical protein